MRPTLPQAVAEARAAGATVEWGRLPDGVRGTYHHPTRTITLAEGMSDTLAVPTLMHETLHAIRGDDGPQPAHVERRIDEAVARRLLTVAEYADAEQVTGARGSGALAVELGVPRWVAAAFRRTLRTTAARTVPHSTPPAPTERIRP